MKGLMTVYRGTLFGESRLNVITTVLPEIGEIICMECGGRGEWPYHPDPKHEGDKCVTCKGSGAIYIS